MTSTAFTFDRTLVALSVAIFAVASTVALWFTVATRRGLHFLGAALILAIAVTGMHYTAMTALRVQMADMPHSIPGVEPTLFVPTILLLSIAALVSVVLCAQHHRRRRFPPAGRSGCARGRAGLSSAGQGGAKPPRTPSLYGPPLTARSLGAVPLGEAAGRFLAATVATARPDAGYQRIAVIGPRRDRTPAAVYGARKRHRLVARQELSAHHRE